MDTIILIETSTALCSAAIARDGKIISSRESAQTKSHASLTAVFIKEMLDECISPLGTLPILPVEAWDCVRICAVEVVHAVSEEIIAFGHRVVVTPVVIHTKLKTIALRLLKPRVAQRFDVAGALGRLEHDCIYLPYEIREHQPILVAAYVAEFKHCHP